MNSVEVLVLKNASQRTKNRIKDNGPFFVIQDTEIRNPICLNGQEGILIKSTTNDWLGWIPASEVKIGESL